MRQENDMKTVERLAPGQLWWDKNREWCDGSKTLNVCYLILSGDKDDGDALFTWRCSLFMWIKGAGYGGAHERHFTEHEVRLMEYVGNIAELKSFSTTSQSDKKGLDIVLGCEACQEMLKVLGLENTEDVKSAVITMYLDDVVMLKVERLVDGSKFKTMLEDYYLVRRKDKEQKAGVSDEG